MNRNAYPFAETVLGDRMVKVQLSVDGEGMKPGTREYAEELLRVAKTLSPAKWEALVWERTYAW
jgi:hypothetical protein